MISKMCLLVVAAMLLSTCKPAAVAASTEPQPSQSNEEQQDNPDYRIIGRVVEVFANRDTIDPESPCGKAPCNALVKVEKVLRFGQIYTESVQEGSTIPIHFAFTLASTTQELFPTADIDLPGLNSNDQFEATIKHRPLRHEPDRFMVFNYIKHSD